MGIRKVGIIGGGPGGLMFAYALQKEASVPFQATLFEATDRLGGKILTPRFTLSGTSYEAGAAELYDYSPVEGEDDELKELVTELGLSISPMRGSAVIMNEHILANLEDIRDRLGTPAGDALAAFDRRARDFISPHEFYYSDEANGVYNGQASRRFDTLLATIPESGARRYVENMIHSDLATEPEKTSVVYGLHNYLMNDPAYMQLYSIEGGNERLPRELAARIRAQVRLRHRATDVCRMPNGSLRVSTTCEGMSREEEFDFVVIALPNDCLPRLSFSGEQLATAMRKHWEHYNHPAHYLRITILFRRPFWRTGSLTDSYWMLDRFGGCCLYDESAREPGTSHSVLGWLIGGDAAETMSEWSDERLIDAALDSLPEFLAQGRDEFREGCVHRWVGAVNAIPGGLVQRSLDRRHQPEPMEHPNLFVVGDYLFDSTLNGVLDSARYVAEWIAARLNEDA